VILSAKDRSIKIDRISLPLLGLMPVHLIKKKVTQNWKVKAETYLNQKLEQAHKLLNQGQL
jgi:hypothetical protein